MLARKLALYRLTEWEALSRFDGHKYKPPLQLLGIWVHIRCIKTKTNTSKHAGEKHSKYQFTRQTVNGPTSRWGLPEGDERLHVPGVAKERSNQKFQFSIMLSHGTVGPVSIRAFKGLPTIYDIDVGLTNFLFQGTGIRSSSESSVDLNSLSQSFLIRDRGRKQFSMGIKEIFEDFQK